jgi:hypothetical protein
VTPEKSVTTAVATPDWLGSAALVALIEWVPTAAGGVYKPDDVIVPELAFPPAMPSTLQVTAWFVLLLTLAEYCCDCLKVSDVARGLTVTATAVVT